MFCKYCGAQIDDNAVVCVKCGRQIAPLKEGKKNDKIIYLLLAIFLGALGAHNFFVGRTKTGIIQLLITVCSFFTLSFFVAIWAIVEACLNLNSPTLFGDRQ